MTTKRATERGDDVPLVMLSPSSQRDLIDAIAHSPAFKEAAPAEQSTEIRPTIAEIRRAVTELAHRIDKNGAWVAGFEAGCGLAKIQTLTTLAAERLQTMRRNGEIKAINELNSQRAGRDLSRYATQYTPVPPPGVTTLELLQIHGYRCPLVPVPRIDPPPRRGLRGLLYIGNTLALRSTPASWKRILWAWARGAIRRLRWRSSREWVAMWAGPDYPMGLRKMVRVHKKFGLGGLNEGPR